MPARKRLPLHDGRLAVAGSVPVDRTGLATVSRRRLVNASMCSTMEAAESELASRPPLFAPALPQATAERVLPFEVLCERLGGIGTSLARRVLTDLPVVRLGDRVLVRERTLDEYIVALDSSARARRKARP